MSQSGESAQFGLSNIPFGIISTPENPIPRPATRLHEQVFSIPDLIEKGYLNSIDTLILSTLQKPTLNEFAAFGRPAHRQVRQCLQQVLSNTSQVSSLGIDISTVIYHLPVTIGDFSDFSCSRDHVLNAGEAVLGKRELPPGFLHFPIGYGGRSSSILPPGTPIIRPLGQFRTPDGVKFGVSRAMDFELEVACVIGKPSQYGKPVSIDDADEHIFGFLLLNDWSARDIQGLEMNPLGPFNGKSLGTSISPWIVTADALEPFRVDGLQKELPLAPYLQSQNRKQHYAVELKVDIEAGDKSATVCESRLDWIYWSVNEMIAHQTINGCPLRAGDVLATGTVSGSVPGSHGCLLEITKGGKEPLRLDDWGERVYLQDGDGVRFRGWAGTPDSPECVGFGSCYGLLEPNSLSNGI